MSLERQYNMLQEQLDDIERGIDDIQNPTVNSLRSSS